MAVSTYAAHAAQRFPGLFFCVSLLTAGGAACASGTVVDDPFELGDAGAGASIGPSLPGRADADSAVSSVASDASLGGTRGNASSPTIDAGDAALAHPPAPDASTTQVSPPTAQQPASTTTPPAVSTTPPVVSTTPPASTPAGHTGGTTSPSKLDASTPPDASGAAAMPAAPGASAGMRPAGAQACKSDDDCAEVFCFPLGVAGCCRLDGACGCTWSDAYCL